MKSGDKTSSESAKPARLLSKDEADFLNEFLNASKKIVVVGNENTSSGCGPSDKDSKPGASL